MTIFHCYDCDESFESHLDERVCPYCEGTKVIKITNNTKELPEKYEDAVKHEERRYYDPDSYEQRHHSDFGNEPLNDESDEDDVCSQCIHEEGHIHENMCTDCIHNPNLTNNFEPKEEAKENNCVTCNSTSKPECINNCPVSPKTGDSDPDDY